MKAVLTVEDHPALRSLIRLTLEFDGYQVHEAVDGADGVARARELRPDLVLMDLTLPGAVDGFEACRRIRQSSGLEAVPVVVLTGRDGPAVQAAATAAGATACLVKPFRPLELVGLTARLIGRP